MKQLIVLCALVAGALASPYMNHRFRRGVNKIVGGVEAKPGELPYQLSFQDLSFGQPWHFCGASIYNENWAICAGHCVKGEDYDNPTYLQVVAGEHNQDATEGHEQAVILTRIVLHHAYNSASMHNDISLLQLSSPLTFNDFVAAIALPEDGYTATGSCTVSGWGTTAEDGTASKVLMKVDVPVISDEECQNDYLDTEFIGSTMLCAGFPQGGKDSCQGDSGGPLVCHDNGDYLAGVVSWGYGCARPRSPGVYTELSHFIDWITTNAN